MLLAECPVDYPEQHNFILSNQRQSIHKFWRSLIYWCYLFGSDLNIEVAQAVIATEAFTKFYWLTLFPIADKSKLSAALFIWPQACIAQISGSAVLLPSDIIRLALLPVAVGGGTLVWPHPCPAQRSNGRTLNILSIFWSFFPINWI